MNTDTNTTKRTFAASALVVTPLAYLASLLLALSAGVGNAAIIAAVPAAFSAAFFGGLHWLAGALERDDRVAVAAAVPVRAAAEPRWSKAA